jgi:DNA-binding transcriptional LysR family regulator
VIFLMDVKQLRQFVMVMRYGSITTAARKLRIAQPALSRQVRTLETELGTALFTRTPKGVAPTAAAQTLFEHAEDILGRLALAREAVRIVGSGAKPPLRVAVPPTLSTRLGTDFLKRCAQECPDFAIRISESWSGYIGKLLETRLIDFGVMSIGQIQDFAVRAPIFSEELFLVRKRRPVDEDTLAPIEAHDLAEVDLILPTTLQGVRILVEDAARRLKIRLRVVAEADAWGAIRSLIEATDACSILSLREIRASMLADAISVRPIIRPRILNEFFLVAYPDETRSSKALGAFDRVAAIMSACMEDDPAPPAR